MGGDEEMRMRVQTRRRAPSRLGLLGLFGITLTALLTFVPPVAAQCAMCRTALQSSAEGRAMAAKLNRGILLLLVAPVGIAGFVGVAMLRSRRRLHSVARDPDAIFP
jgi:hypothetical protein